MGSNIEPRENVRKMIEIMSAESTLLGQSGYIITKPDGYQDQNDFLNGAIIIETEQDHVSLKRYLKEVEKRLGRVKGPIKSGPRTMDLDIIVWGDEVVDRDFYKKDYIRTPVQELLDRFGIRPAFAGGE